MSLWHSSSGFFRNTFKDFSSKCLNSQENSQDSHFLKNISRLPQGIFTATHIHRFKNIFKKLLGIPQGILFGYNSNKIPLFFFQNNPIYSGTLLVIFFRKFTMNFFRESFRDFLRNTTTVFFTPPGIHKGFFKDTQTVFSRQTERNLTIERTLRACDLNTEKCFSQKLIQKEASWLTNDHEAPKNVKWFDQEHL